MLNPESMKKIDDRFQQRKDQEKSTENLTQVDGDNEVESKQAVEMNKDSSPMLPVEIAEMLIDA